MMWIVMFIIGLLVGGYCAVKNLDAYMLGFCIAFGSIYLLTKWWGA